MTKAAATSSGLERDLAFEVPGLGAAARIRVDRWGIPHIEAANLADLWLVQGFNAARDRLFQIDLWRKRGLGLLAADFGPGYLEQDKASRMFLYRGDMDAEWASYASDAKEICQRFVDGINGYIALAEKRPELLPPEFGMLGTKPGRWRAEDVVRIRNHGLNRNALWEVQRLHMLARADAKADLLRRHLYPIVDVEVPEGITAEDCPLEALTLFLLAQANVSFSTERLAASLADAPKWRKLNELNDVIVDAEFSGSNNWVVAPQRTTTGYPILASDPHRAHSLPSLRYIQHLRAPGYDAIGAGEPCVPGISIGHNGEAAFGLTIFGADQEDVYVLETDPAAPHRYKFDGGWRDMRVVEEVVPVKGHPDQRYQIAFSHHGPIVWRNAAKTRAVVVRSVWFEPGTAPYLQSLTMLRTKTADAFRASAERWGAPTVNLVYADRKGDIAWSPAGHMPLRPTWKGLTPVPGTGAYEWAGRIDPAAMPFVRNPANGFFATANEMNLPADWPHDKLPVGFEWAEPSRAKRIHEVLSADTAHNVASSAALQTDTVSLPARRLIAVLKAIAHVPADLKPALDLLADWDCRTDADSAAAALFEVWYTKHLRGAVFKAIVPEAAHSLLPPGDVEGICNALVAPDERWGADPVHARDALVIATLTAAWADLTARLGSDCKTWQWGALHHGQFNHALAEVDPAAKAYCVGPLPKGGSPSTPMNAVYRPSDFRITNGASFRMVVDLSDLDKSVTINAPGQSGDPRSSHFADLAPQWAKGEFVPLLYTDAAIGQAVHFEWTLKPA